MGGYFPAEENRPPLFLPARRCIWRANRSPHGRWNAAKKDAFARAASRPHHPLPDISPSGTVRRRRCSAAPRPSASMATAARNFSMRQSGPGDGFLAEVVPRMGDVPLQRRCGPVAFASSGLRFGMILSPQRRRHGQNAAATPLGTRRPDRQRAAILELDRSGRRPRRDLSRSDDRQSGGSHQRRWRRMQVTNAAFTAALGRVVAAARPPLPPGARLGGPCPPWARWPTNCCWPAHGLCRGD